MPRMNPPKSSLPLLRKVETEELVEILTGFDWSDFGLDLVEEADPEWARELATVIIMKWERLT